MTNSKEPRTLNLCPTCAEKLGRGFALCKASADATGATAKTVCDECGKRRYGAAYALRRKGQ